MCATCVAVGTVMWMATMSVLLGAVASRLRHDEQGEAVLLGGDVDHVLLVMFGVGAAAVLFDDLVTPAQVVRPPAEAREWLAAAVIACRAGDDDRAVDCVTDAFAAGDAITAWIDLLVDFTSAQAAAIGMIPLVLAQQMCSATAATLGGLRH